jgi:ribosomal protein S18 acetylase RimI-like enzyme
VETAAQARIAADAIARGFQDNEVWTWLIRGSRARARVERRSYYWMIRRIFVPRQSAWMTESGTGASLWFPPGTKALDFGEKLAEGLPFLPEGLPSIGKATRLNDLVSSHWPDEPHWYLSVLSIEPASQGKGHGSALIAPGLDRADAEGVGVWLETQSERNLPFYARFDFELITRVEADPGIPLWMMWRPPARTAGAAA